MITALQKGAALSIALGLAACAALPGFAGGLEACRALNTSWSCEGGASRLIVTDETDGASGLTYQITAAQAGTSAADRLLTLAAGAWGTVELGPGAPPKRLSVAGSGPGGACCFSTLRVPPRPAGLCAEAGAPGPSGREPEAEPQPPAGARDTGVALALASPCGPGAAGNTCTGVLTLTHAGDLPPVAALPLTLAGSGARMVSQSLSGPLGCRAVGADAALFCQIPRDVLRAAPLELPLRLDMAPVYAPARVTLCAALGPPGDVPTQIALVQTALAALGHDPGPADGAAGPRTRAAVAAFAARLGIETDDPLAPALLAALGLLDHSDAVASNNRACASADLTPLPPPRCDARTAVARGGACVCRYARMRLRGEGLSCGCTGGRRFVPGAGCLRPEPGPVPKPEPKPIPVPDDSPPPAGLSCDPATTVLRGGACACRFRGMVRAGPERCVCTKPEGCT